MVPRGPAVPFRVESSPPVPFKNTLISPPSVPMSSDDAKLAKVEAEIASLTSDVEEYKKAITMTEACAKSVLERARVCVHGGVPGIVTRGGVRRSETAAGVRIFIGVSAEFSCPPTRSVRGGWPLRPSVCVCVWLAG